MAEIILHDFGMKWWARALILQAIFIVILSLAFVAFYFLSNSAKKKKNARKAARAIQPTVIV